MKKILIGLAVLPLLADSASAIGRLSDFQLDTVTAGLSIFDVNCPGCAFATSTSMSSNGVTTTASSVMIASVLRPANGGDSGSGAGGGGDGGGSVTNGPGAPNVPHPQSALPVSLAAVVASASTITISNQ